MATILLSFLALMILGLIALPIVSHIMEHDLGISRISGNDYGSSLETYITSRKPTDICDVERLTREFDLKNSKRSMFS